MAPVPDIETLMFKTGYGLNCKKFTNCAVANGIDDECAAKIDSLAHHAAQYNFLNI